jgi:hypothetical protein
MRASLFAPLLAIGCAVGVQHEPFGEGGAELASSEGDDPWPDWDIPPHDDESSSDGESSGESSTTDDPPLGCAAIDVLVVVESPATDDWAELGWAYAGYAGYYESFAQGLAVLVETMSIATGVADVRVLVTGSMPADSLCELNSCGAGCLDVVADECDTLLGAGRNGFAIPQYEVSECTSGRFVEGGELNAGSLQCLVRGTGLECGPANYNSAGPDTLWDAVSAAASEHAVPGGCNADFLREDALLVVVLFAPGQDPIVDTSANTYANARARLVEAKGGDEADVVALALGGNVAGGDALCESELDSTLAADMRDFVDASAWGAFGSACTDDVDGFFSAGAQIVADACTAFDP